MAATPRLNLTASTSRATGVLQLEWEYRNAPGYINQSRDGLAKAELDATLTALKSAGWMLESQCANPGRDTYVETFTFTREASAAE